MSETTTRTATTSRPNAVYLIAALLEVGALTIVLLSLAGIVGRVILSPKEAPPVALVVELLQIVGSAWPALLLFAMAILLRRFERLCSNVELLAATGSESEGSSASVSAIQELVALTREQRDIALLNEQERSQRMKVIAAELASQLEEEVPALLREHDWREAWRRVRGARERFPGMAAWGRLESQIDGVRSMLEARDLEHTARAVADLESMGAWDRVGEELNALMQRHPQSARVGEYVEGIRRERQRIDAEQCARLMAQAQDATNRREWTEALQLVQTILRKFPTSPEAAELRGQLPTVTANAEIQARQKMEAEIRDLIKDHKYDQALRVAHELVDQYPNSPQAAILRDQIPRLEQRAAETAERP